jgi:hypothetical protein
MDIFADVISEHGTDERPIADMPEVRCIGIEKLRTAFYRRRGDESLNTKRSAFNRALSAATAAKFILAAENDSGALLWKD